MASFLSSSHRKYQKTKKNSTPEFKKNNELHYIQLKYYYYFIHYIQLLIYEYIQRDRLEIHKIHTT